MLKVKKISYLNFSYNEFVLVLDNTDLIHLSTCLSSENIMQYFQSKSFINKNSNIVNNSLFLEKGQRKNQGIKKLKK